MNSSKNSPKKPAVHLLYRLLGFCSTRCLFKIAGWLAFILSRTKNQLSTQARMNVQLCFPQLEQTQQNRIVEASIHHTGCAFFELAAIWYRPVEQLQGLIHSQDIDAQFLQSLKAKLVIVPHHGSWEFLNLWLSGLGPLYSLYKPTRNKALDLFVKTNRSKNGALLVPVNTSGLRKLLKGLKNGANCLILPDQRPGNKTAQTLAPFYGHPAPTSLLVKNLAAKVDCEIYIAAMTRYLDAGGYKLKIRQLEKEKFLSDDMASATYLNTSIEAFIAPELEQYQWPYRRFDRDIYNGVT